MRVFVARPDDADPSTPAVIVVQEWWGLNEQIRGVARRLGDEGFITAAPDLYRGALTTEPDEARKLSMGLDAPAAVEDVRALVGWLLDQGASGVAIMGFCMGGRITWAVARSEPRLAAALPFYGSVDFDEGGPVLVPFQAHYGTEDRFPPEMYDRIREHVDDAAGSELHLYEGIGHGFLNEEHADDFDADAAALAWERALEYLRERL